MQPTLYGSRGSGSAAIEMALRAAGIDYRVVRASTWEPDSARAELQRINPLGQIPTLVLADGTVLSESAAILIHLGLEHPASGLLPVASSERALAIRGLVFIAANCYSAVSIIDYPQRWTTAVSKPAQARVGAAARAQLHRNWEIFADQFGSDAVLSTASPGALAFLATVVSSWAGSRAHLQASRARFHAALLRLETDRRIAPVLLQHRGA